MYIILDGDIPIEDKLGQVYSAKSEAEIEKVVEDFLRLEDSEDIVDIDITVFMEDMSVDYEVRYLDNSSSIGELFLKKIK